MQPSKLKLLLAVKNLSVKFTIRTFVNATLGTNHVNGMILRKCVKNAQSGFQKIQNFEKIRDMSSRIQDQ